MSGHEQETDVRDSTPNSTGPDRAAGGMGVSSERVGHTGPGQYATDGIKDTSRIDEPTEDAPDVGLDGAADYPGHDGSEATDRLRTSDEVMPEGLPSKAGYPSLDPRSAKKPFNAAPDVKHS